VVILYISGLRCSIRVVGDFLIRRPTVAQRTCDPVGKRFFFIIMAGDPECYTARTGSAPNPYIVRTLASAVKTLAGEFVKIFLVSRGILSTSKFVEMGLGGWQLRAL
jgi:hypothetical protein